MRRDVEIPVFRDPHGNSVRATISFVLTDLAGRRIAGVDDSGEPVVDYRQILTGDEATSIPLTPTDQISPPSQYRVDIATPAGRTRHVVQIESGATELTFAELLALPAGVASGEILSNRLLPDPTGLPNDYAAIVRDGAWIGTNEIPTLAGTDGRELQVQVDGNQLQTKYEDELAWTNIYDLSQLQGSPVEVGVDAGHIAYRVQGDAEWIPIYPLSLLEGPAGDEVEMGANSTHVLWRYVGEADWRNLISLDLIRGEDGTGVTILGELPDELSLPLTGNPGDAYLILGDLWTWAGDTWVNSGSIQGPAGKSVELSKLGTDIVWRNVGDDAWVVLIPLADIKGDPGDEGPSPEMRADSGEIQFKRSTDLTWTTIVTFAQLYPTPGEIGAEAVGVAAAADSAHTSAFNHALIATAVQPAALQAVEDAIPTTPAEVGAEPAGAVAAHELGFDHTLISTAVQPARSVGTTAPLTGGGDLSADRTIGISEATTAAAGSMSAADKSKLDGVEAGATANSSDATLLDRANHTGTQSSTTITGLGGAAVLNVGTTAGTVAAGDDARLSDARTPIAHKTTHATGGADALTAADIGAATASHDHTGVYDPAGTASSAVGTHESTFAHDDIAVAVQLPVDLRVFGFLPGTSEVVLAFDPATYLVSLTPTGAEWSYFRDGKRTITGAKSVRLVASGVPPDDSYYVYINSDDGELVSSVAPWILGPTGTAVPVAYIEYNSALTPTYQLYSELHPADITRGEHSYLHSTRGAQYASGGALVDETLQQTTNVGNVFGITEAVYYDETLKHVIPALAKPDGATAAYTVRYREAGAWLWSVSDMPYRYSGTYIYWDNLGVETPAVNGDFLCTYILLAPNGHQIVHAQSVHASLALAEAEQFQSLDLTGLAVAEFVAVEKLVWRCGSAYTQKGKCRLESVQRINVSSVPASVSPVVVLPQQVSVEEIAAGTEATLRSYSPADVVSIIDAHALTPADAASFDAAGSAASAVSGHELAYLHDYLNLTDTERAIMLAALPDYNLIRLDDGSYAADDTGALLNLNG